MSRRGESVTHRYPSGERETLGQKTRLKRVPLEVQRKYWSRGVNIKIILYYVCVFLFPFFVSRWSPWESFKNDTYRVGGGSPRSPFLLICDRRRIRVSMILINSVILLIFFLPTLTFTTLASSLVSYLSGSLYFFPEMVQSLSDVGTDESWEGSRSSRDWNLVSVSTDRPRRVRVFVRTCVYVCMCTCVSISVIKIYLSKV